LIQNANGLKGLGINADDIIETIEELSKHVSIIKKLTNEMVGERKKVNKMEDSRARAIAYCDQVKAKYFDQIRYSVDKLELLVDDEDWPLVKYRELLFLR
jgi:glutamine synthetase